MRSISTLSIFLTLIACNRSQGDFLTESQQYEVIQEGLIPYLDSMEYDLIFYDHYKPADTSFFVSMLAEYRTMREGFMAAYARSNVQNLTSKESEIKTKMLNGITFVNPLQLDSIRRNNDSTLKEKAAISSFKEVFTLTRPFKPDTCNSVLIEIFPIEFFESCFPPPIRYIILEEENNKWVVKREI
jgi:hypothetical protein